MTKKRKLPEKICCIGAGYVGGPTMAVLARKCPSIEVTVVDTDSRRIAAWNSENLPVYEHGLDEIIKEVRGKNLFFSMDSEAAIEESELIFISVNTFAPKAYEKKTRKIINLEFIEQCAQRIVSASKRNRIVVEKSTVPVNTAEMIKQIIRKNCLENEIQVLSNPEFLAAGTAIQDLCNPDRILIGGGETGNEREAVEVLSRIYENWVPSNRIIKTTLWSAELSKLTANAFLAQRISSINAISALCEVTKADVEEVSRIIGGDNRIGRKFLKASIGFGGSCLQKDILTLVYLCEHFGLPEVAAYWKDIVTMNNFQTQRFSKNIIKALVGKVTGKKIAVFGFAFKKDTNDTRESPAIKVCLNLLEKQANVGIYDPKVKENQIREDLSRENGWEHKLKIYSNPYDACLDSHAVVILTEWDEFRELNYQRIFDSMKKPAFLFDGRNILDNKAMQKIGFQTKGIGKA